MIPQSRIERFGMPTGRSGLSDRWRRSGFARSGSSPIGKQGWETVSSESRDW